ncbi:3620_t:CDS:2, partial [Dentiscutata heterogama]
GNSLVQEPESLLNETSTIILMHAVKLKGRQTKPIKKGAKRKAETPNTALPLDQSVQNDFPNQISNARRVIQSTQPFKPIPSKNGCLHLKEYKENNRYTYLDNYNTIAELSMHWYRIGIPNEGVKDFDGLRRDREIILSHQKCSICSFKGDRLHACLDCVFIGCWRDQRHALKHFHGTTHTFAMDIVRLALFCFKCGDYVYDLDFETAKTLQEVRVAERESNLKEPCAKRARYVSWQSNSEEAANISRNSTPLPCSGLRGLFNMGATCFMNAILQTFLTNPLIKNYFMTDKHNNKLCGTAGCMCCEIDNLFQEFHSGEKKPYPPCSFLHAMWLSSKELAGYAEQDAHEFYLAAINKMHSDSKESILEPLSSSGQKCECIMHKTFGGVFQSRIKCKVCNDVKTKEEPLVEWQLHLRGSPTQQKKKNGHTKASIENYTDEMGDKNTLQLCLERYTAEEQIMDYKCDVCNLNYLEEGVPFNQIPASSEACTRRFSCKKLPPVLTFVVERFSREGKTTSKNEAPFEFPEEINMTKWTSLAQEVLEQGGSLDDLPDFKYNLISVVNHEGKINTGHYTVYCKNRDQWFLFDDHAVKLADIDDVLQSKRKAYLCFYIADTLEYDQL